MASQTHLAHRSLYLIAGWWSVVLGIIGLFLPLLPTTPFILLSAYCFSKSSPRYHQWLLNHPRLGPMIRDWQENGIIRKAAKIQATALIVLCFSGTLYWIRTHWQLQIGLIAIALGVLSFIWTRPSQVRAKRPSTDGR